MVRYLRLTNEHMYLVTTKSGNCVCAKYTLLLNDNKQESVNFFVQNTNVVCQLM